MTDSFRQKVEDILIDLVNGYGEQPLRTKGDKRKMYEVKETILTLFKSCVPVIDKDSAQGFEGYGEYKDGWNDCREQILTKLEQ